MPEPVAVNDATVPEPQKDCAAVPVGADGVVFTVAVTSNLALDSHPELV